VLALCAAAAGWCLYHYQLDDALRSKVESILADHYTDLSVSVESARLQPGEGVEVRGISIRDPRLPELSRELVFIEELFLAGDVELANLLNGKIDIERIEVRRPTLRAARLATGSWTTASLLPLPKMGEGPMAPVEVIDGAVELRDLARPKAAPFEFSRVALTVSTNGSGPPNPSARGQGPPQRPDLVVAGGATGGTLRRLDIRARVSQQDATWEATGQVIDLELSSRLVAWLPDRLREKLGNSAEIGGRVSASLRIASPAGPGEACRYGVVATVEDGSIRHARLAAPVTDIHGRVVCENGQFTVRDIEGRFAGGRLLLSAEPRQASAGGGAVVRAELLNFELSPGLRASLPDEFQQVWDQFHPRGKLSAQAELTHDHNGWNGKVDVELLDVSLVYSEFPLPIRHAKGAITYTTDRRLVANVTATAGGKPIVAKGQVQNLGRQATGWLEINTGESIRIDEKLIAAVPPSVREVVESLNPSGSLRAGLRMERTSPERPLETRALIELERCQITYTGFPYPLRQVEGTIEVRGSRWLFRDLRGRNDSGYITCQGSWDSRHDGGRLSLDFVGVDIPLEDELRAALDEELQGLWTDLRLRGTVDHATLAVRYDTRDEDPSEGETT